MNKVVTIAGQITCSVFIDGVVYLGVYGHALVLAYRPGGAFVFDKNPSLLAAFGHGQNRPMGIYSDGFRLYMVTRANYGELGGATTVIEPSDGRREVFHNVVPTQNPVSFLQHGELLAGTTEIYGDQGSCAAEAENAVIFVWSMAERIPVHSVVPWPAKSLRALAISPVGILIGFGPEKYFLFDMESGRCSRYDWVGMKPSSGIFLDENRFLAMVPEPGGNDAVRLLELPAHTICSLGESVPLRFFETLGPDTLLAAADGAGIVKVCIHDY